MDIDQLNSTMDRLLKVEESLFTMVRHLEAGALKSMSSVPTPVKSIPDELFLEIEAFGSGKGKI